MLWRASEIKGYEIHGSDGQIGNVTDLLFDDKTWMTKWLTVRTGSWLFGCSILLRVSILGKPDRGVRQVSVPITRRQVKDSPHASTDLPVSRFIEADAYSYDDKQPFWQIGSSPRGLRGEGTTLFMPRVGRDADPLYQAGTGTRATPGDTRLRSATDMTGYHMAATDGPIGHIEDFLFDDSDWCVKYLLVDTKNWLPGQRVVLSPRSIREISWSMRSIYLNVDHERMMSSPLYDSGMTDDGPYNDRFEAHFGLTSIGSASRC